MRIALRRGRLEHQRASALITSANDSLVGNLQPDYWRFEGGINVDGALRAAASEGLPSPLRVAAMRGAVADLARSDAAAASEVVFDLEFLRFAAMLGASGAVADNT